MAIEVLKELKNTYPNAALCMVGPDKDGTQADVQQLIKRYQLHDSVEITGVLSKEDWHKKSEDFDIFINTTNVDNTPVSVIEAMALGLPVVSTNAGGLPYLINNGKDGILIEKESEIRSAPVAVAYKGKSITKFSPICLMYKVKKIKS